ncbi:MAG: aminopeptidase [Lachnospirales bacterium]
MDIRNQKLAKSLINYSCKLKKGEKVLIEGRGSDTEELVNCCIKEANKAGAYPFVNLLPESVERNIILNSTAESLQLLSKLDCARMDEMDAYIGIRGTSNATEFSDIPKEKIENYAKIYSTPVHHDRRVANTKWVVLRYPNKAMAQLAETSSEAFEEFYYNVCNLDYSKMATAMTPLVDLMNKTDKVRIVGNGTDLSFSIKDIPTIKCAGELNIPDGEVYTAPVKNSVNGKIAYNTPSPRGGFVYENIVLEFKDGKIINATANNTKRINEIFDIDEGARYVGEFAIGINPFINKPMKDTLFDEKIAGSIHFTPGSCYNDAYNGNSSSLHWDLVLIQTEEYGGGEIYFDDVLIRKNGKFLLPELECLNPENLK